MKNVIFFLLCYICIPSSLLSQSNISGRIIDTEDNSIPFANILLLNPTDSTLVKGELSSIDGEYTFEAVANGQYIVASSYIGYNTYYSGILEVLGSEPIKLNDIILSEGVALSEVQIVAKKPIFEQKIDRLVVNVSNTITSAGSTALEVLERSPGVVVNQQSNALSLVGKEGVVIMINGKITYQPSESIMQMLSGMSSDNIESIELITTPPANYDAEGNAGFINILLKERPDLGLNGNASLSIGYGEGETGTTALNLNYRRGIINVFANYNYLLKAQKQVFYNYRKVNFSGIRENELTTDRDPQQVNHNLRIGTDLQVTPNTVIGVLLSAYDNNWSMVAENNSTNILNSSITDKVNLINNETNNLKHYGANLNVEQQIGEKGRLNLNLDYLNYELDNPNTYDINYLSSADLILRQEDTRSSKFTPIDISVVQLDFSNSLNDRLSYMTGIKIGKSKFNNDVSAETFTNGSWNFIEQFTNESDLNEDILAAFASADYALNEKNKFKFGLRYEYTDSKLNTVKDGAVIDRQFGSLFPSIFYTYNINDKQSMNLSYSKRITRPTFNDMAPFAIFLDPNTFFFGNAGLQPAITNSVKADYRINSYLLSIQYSKEDSTIARFQDRVNIESNQQLFEPINLSNTETFSASLSVPLYIGNDYTMQNNLIVLHTSSKSYYDETLVNITNTSFNFNSTHSYNFDKNHSVELNGFYNSYNYFGRSYFEPFYGISFGFQKKFKNGSTLRFNVRDIMNSIKFRGGTDLPEEGFETYGDFDFSNRTFSLGYSFNFGNQKLESSRNRQTGSEEERKRVN